MQTQTEQKNQHQQPTGVDYFWNIIPIFSSLRNVFLAFYLNNSESYRNRLLWLSVRRRNWWRYSNHSRRTLSYRVFWSEVCKLALLQDYHVLPDGVQVSDDLLHSDFLSVIRMMIADLENMWHLTYSQQLSRGHQYHSVSPGTSRSYLLCFGNHVFVDDVHVGGRQGNQGGHNQLSLTLLKTCSQGKITR